MVNYLLGKWAVHVRRIVSGLNTVKPAIARELPAVEGPECWFAVQPLSCTYNYMILFILEMYDLSQKYVT